YVSHLIEDGVDPRFVQQQAGHSRASTTSTYTTVGQDARNRMLRSPDEASIPPCIVIEARKTPDRLDGQNISQRESGRISKLRVLLLERARGRQGADPVVVDALAA